MYLFCFNALTGSPVMVIIIIIIFIIIMIIMIIIREIPPALSQAALAQI